MERKKDIKYFKDAILESNIENTTSAGNFNNSTIIFVEKITNCNLNSGNKLLSE